MYINRKCECAKKNYFAPSDQIKVQSDQIKVLSDQIKIRRKQTKQLYFLFVNYHNIISLIIHNMNIIMNNTVTILYIQ